MIMAKPPNARGFTLAEVLMTTLLMMVVVAAVMTLFKSASDAGRNTLLRADVQQSARGSLAIINRDLNQASIGIPPSGIALPAGTRFACDQTQCYLTAGNDTYPNNTLSPVTPGDNKGPNGTDVITIAYLDPTWPVNNQNLIALAADGSTVTVNTGTFDTSGNPAAAAAGGRDYQDPVVGTRVGDVLLIQNSNGPAVATVTKVDAAGVIELQPGDPLNMNQTGAPAANVASLGNPPRSGTYPTTTASRINVVTYFIFMNPGPDGILGTADDVPTLMRQVGGKRAIPVAEYVTGLQFSYDIFNAGAGVNGTYTAGLDGAAVANASQIRKISLSLTLNSEFKDPQGNTHSLTVSSTVSPRDLSFSDRYQ
jgi:type II secretory pathway pseudopilin PulG